MYATELVREREVLSSQLVQLTQACATLQKKLAGRTAQTKKLKLMVRGVCGDLRPHACRGGVKQRAGPNAMHVGR